MKAGGGSVSRCSRSCVMTTVCVLLDSSVSAISAEKQLRRMIGLHFLL